ncbi:MAG: hypothetical protein ACR2OL_03680 [Anderseniella sp.]
MNLFAHLAFKTVAHCVLLQQLLAIADTGLQLGIGHFANLIVFAQISPSLPIYLAFTALLLGLGLLLRNRLHLWGLGGRGTACRFCACCLNLLAYPALKLAAQTLLLQQVATIADSDLQLVIVQVAHLGVVAQIAPGLTIRFGRLILLLLNRLGLLLLLLLLLNGLGLLLLLLLLLNGLRLLLFLLLLLNGLRLLLLLLLLSRLSFLILASFEFALNPAKLAPLLFAATIGELTLQNLLALQQLFDRHLPDLVLTLRNAANWRQRKASRNHQRTQHG